ncbi:MAG: hypothetical protein JNM94_18805 [Phycisphaerae bacterium]|nr:hypothetical protein [Phycisphaerae bacterium]
MKIGSVATTEGLRCRECDYPQLSQHVKCSECGADALRFRVVGYQFDRSLNASSGAGTGTGPRFGGASLPAGARLFWHVQGVRLSIGRTANVDDRFRALRGALDVRLESLRDETLWRIWIPFQTDEGETTATWQLPRARDEQIVVWCGPTSAIEIATQLRAFVCEARGLTELPTPLVAGVRNAPTLQRVGWSCADCGYALAAGDGRCAECGGVRPEWRLRGRCPTARSATGKTSSRLQRRVVVVALLSAFTFFLALANLVPSKPAWMLLSTVASLVVGTAVAASIAFAPKLRANSAEAPADFSWHVSDAILEIGSPLDPWYVLPLEAIRSVRVEPTGTDTQWRITLDVDRAPTKMHALQPNVFGGGLQIVINARRDEADGVCDSLLDLVRRARGTGS